MFLFWLFFSFRGRIGRYEFIPAYLIATSIIISIGFNAGFHGREIDYFGFVAIFIAAISELSLKFKRSHDLGLSGFWFLLASPLGVVLLIKGLALANPWFVMVGIVQLAFFIRLLSAGGRNYVYRDGKLSAPAEETIPSGG